VHPQVQRDEHAYWTRNERPHETGHYHVDWKARQWVFSRKDAEKLTKAYRAQADEYDGECDEERASGAGDSIAESLEGLEASEYNARAHHRRE
jgi:hypothetical protein